ncbi:MAG: LptF/LptG family permease [Pirellulales bacterium]|nr:LptF/LptG family permease [Pirellulales bacterium]
MYILTRYVVWEVIKFFLAALAVLTLMTTIGMGVKEGLKAGFPPLVMLRTMPYMLPEMLGITIPAAMLYAVSSVFGRMTGANEIVALKSSGISPMAAVWPVLVFAAFLSLGTVWMYEIAATWCRPSVHEIGYESLEEVAYGMLQKKSSFDCEQLNIVVKRVENRRLIQPTIILKGKPGRPQITITAAEAELSTDWDAKMLRIICMQGEVDVEGQMRMSFLDTQEYSVPIVVAPIDPFHRDWVSLGSIPRLIEILDNSRAEAKAELRQLENLRRANKALEAPGSEQADAEIEAKRNKIADYRYRILRLKAEPYRRWSNGFTCLCFALIGTPVAMLRRNADALTNFFVCFLPILAVYYPLLMFGEDLSTSGALPPISFWTGNVVLSIPAVFLLRRIVRH